MAATGLKRGANAAHGLRRTNADKRRGAQTLLRDEEWSQWSDREIARQCNAGPHLVAEIRSYLCERQIARRAPSSATARPIASIWSARPTRSQTIQKVKFY
jgi:hypothetical protein